MREININRRELLLRTAKLFTGAALSPPLFDDDQTTPDVTNPDDPDIEDKNLLDQFTSLIAPEKDLLLPLVEQNELFLGFQDACNDRRVEDFTQYFEMYKAGELKYGVPWFLLWVIHVQETMVSTFPDPGVSGYVGAMQRNAYLWRDYEVDEASQDVNYLRLLPQRYNSPRTLDDPNSYSVDYKEILWGASFIQRQAQIRYLGLYEQDPVSAMLEVVRRNYSNEVYGQQRVRKYQELSEIFAPVYQPQNQMGVFRSTRPALFS